MKNRFILPLLIILIGCVKNSEPTTSEVSEELIIKEFQHQLERDLEDDNINGSISAAIVKGEKIIWSRSLGYIDRDTKSKANSHTIYRVGSITKTFTSFLMMQLYEDQVIDLNDAIENYVPEIKEIKGYSKDTRFTFIQLANHTTGLNREPDFEDAHNGDIEHWEQKVLESLPHTSFRDQPGKRYAYSNIGYAILGLALSRAAKKPYIELIQEMVFNPLEMNDSYFDVPESKKSHIAQGMEGGPFGELNLDTPNKEHLGRGYKVPNGAIYSTPNDMAKFMIAMKGYQNLISKRSIDLMLAPPSTEEENWWQSYGLGTRLLRDHIVSTSGHTGTVSGYVANFMYQREGDYGVVIMRNYNWGMTNIDLRSFAVLRRLKRLGASN